MKKFAVTTAAPKNVFPIQELGIIEFRVVVDINATIPIKLILKKNEIINTAFVLNKSLFVS